MLKSSQFVRLPGATHPQSRVFCFPFAGGSPAVFSGWGQKLGPEIEVQAAHPRGRGMRFRERPDVMVQGMVEDYYPVLRSQLDLPFLFYGHSLGGLIAFELTRRLEADGLPLPRALLLGASAPPHLGLIHEAIHHLPDDEFVTALQERYAGIPQEVLSEPELLAMFLPALKADFTAYERHQHMQAKPLQTTIRVFAGISDPGLSPQLHREWERHTRGEFSLQEVAGGHFFLTESSAAVLESIRESLAARNTRDLVSAHRA
jgi:medium-chain acyl-[acyl-carrier-protein] hydrolase